MSFTRSLYKWKHIVCTLLCSASFTLHYSHGFHLYLSIELKSTHYLDIPLYKSITNLLICSVVVGYMGCFQIWAIMNNNALSMSFGEHVGISIWHRSRCRISGSGVM